MDDQLLYKRVKDGDEEAFEILFRKYYEGLLRFIWGYTKSEAIAEELIQDIFLKLWKNRNDLDIRESLTAYLFRSARNKSLDYIRHADVERSWADEKKSLYDPTHNPVMDDHLHDRMMLDEVKRAIQSLPERRREIFILSRYEGMSYKEIAEVLDISVSTVETQISRALKTLRNIFEPYLTFMGLMLISLLV